MVVITFHPHLVGMEDRVSESESERERGGERHTERGRESERKKNGGTMAKGRYKDLTVVPLSSVGGKRATNGVANSR